ncbi:hypothetical protein ES711_07155 [Gelidibacter salicanalis]|uniref:Uncharacterized protein n=1 Tax=Gelidibacter salicanalis TaxID=291193 RepID=A0A5C7AIR5_9FLAO|nr:hypothetical protein [Gelidibacter salicanalis]TXE08281.1 hypothetical protein ES711_07155 [Gelidibacter salicanalis]
MNIISTIDYQTLQIRKLLMDDFEKGMLIQQFKVCEEETKFLDFYALQSYITETNIINLIVLKSIQYNCTNIINLWNEKLINLPDDMFEKCFFIKDEPPIIRFSTWFKFHAIYLKDSEFQFYDTIFEKKQFIKKHNDTTKSFIIQDIIIICNNILNFITSAYPEILPQSQADFKQINKDLSNDNVFEMKNHLIPKIDIYDVFKHFEVLTKTTNKNDEFYLTNEQLLIFIKTTFADKKPIKQNFNCKGFQKKKVRKVFYDFYFNNKNKETNHTRLKRKYFNIMNDAFYGFNENDYTDFAK